MRASADGQRDELTTVARKSVHNEFIRLMTFSVEPKSRIISSQLTNLLSTPGRVRGNKNIYFFYQEFNVSPQHMQNLSNFMFVSVNRSPRWKNGPSNVFYRLMDD